MNNISALGLIVLSLGLTFFIGKPMFADLKDTLSEKEEYLVAIENLRSVNTLKDSLQNQLESLSASDREKIDNLLPSKPDSIKLISDISSIASRYGIAIQTASFSETNRDDSRSVEGGSGKVYNSGTINFDFTTNYSRFKDFITDVESSLRLVDVRTVSINTNNTSELSYKVSAEIYWLSVTDIEKI